MARFVVTVYCSALDETETVRVTAADMDDAYSADIGSELPEDWPDEGWEVIDVESDDFYESSDMER